MESGLRFLGYGVRRTDVPTGWGAFAHAGVDEICSVADCIAKRPDAWVQRWDFNRACCYDTEASALAAAGGESGFRVLAYALVPVRLNENSEEVSVDVDAVLTQGLPDLPTAPIANGFIALGCDVVSREGPGLTQSANSVMLDFGHSPLSCNALAGEVGVNRYCLIDDVEASLRLAQQWDRDEPEPGPYYVVQVLRRL
jgi:hypothetical protein